MTRTRAGRRRDDRGQALVLVLVVSFVLTIALATALTTSISAFGMSGQYSSSSQALLASQSGISAELAAMRAAGSFTALPCSASGTTSVGGESSSFAVTATYYYGSIALTCSGTGSTLGGATSPTSATLTSTGTAPHGRTSVTKADLLITTSESYGPQFNYAIFTEQNLSFQGAATLKDSGSYVPNAYAGQTIACPNGTNTQGGFTTQLPISLTGNCQVGGDLVSAGGVTMANSTGVGGSVTSYGTGITMSGTASIGKNAAEVNGPINLSASATIGGNAVASGTITAPSGAIKGSQTPLDGALGAQSVPAALNWPAVEPGPGSFPIDWNVIQVPGNGYNCTPGDPLDYFYNYSDGITNDPFQTAISTATQKTFIYAPTCAISFSRSHDFALGDDVVLDVDSATFANQNYFESTSLTPHDFSILADTGQPPAPQTSCSTSGVDLSFSNQTDFVAPTGTGDGTTLLRTGLNVFLYTPGQASYANAPSMTGQVFACGGFTGTNAFTFYFSPLAGEEIPGSGTPLPPTVTVVDKYLVP